MLGRFKCNHWQIAYRKKGMESFSVINNPKWGWCADPFLVKYKGELYLFAEAFLYKSERNGVIVYCKWTGDGFSEWTVTMDKHWHLSYPNVFVYNDELYMCPESYQREEIGVYRLKTFPDKWEKVTTILENGKYVDSTFLIDKNEKYMFTFCPEFHDSTGKLLLYKFEENKVSDPVFVTDDISLARPGGNIIKKSGTFIRVSQDCSKGYGYGLVFNQIESLWPVYQEKVIERWTAEDILVDEKNDYIGIHTYNCVDNLEVIDLKFRKTSVLEYFARKRVRKVFVNKYI